MKIIMIECDAEEMRANRTIMDTLTDAVNKLTDSMFGENISRKSVISALANVNEEEEGDGE